MAIDYTTPAEAISEASTLFSGLIVGAPDLPDFPEPPTVVIDDPGEIPADLSAAITIPSVEELTSGAVAGEGVFDRIMSSLNAHIESQYHKNILGQSELAQVYVAAIQAALPQAVSFMLTSSQSYWNAKLVQIQAQNLWLERAKLQAELQTAKLVAYRAQAEAVTAQMQAITAQTQYANQKLALVSTLQDVNNKETAQGVQEEQYNLAYVQTHSTLPGGGAPLGVVAKDLELKDKQIDLADSQIALVAAQVNVQRAQTYDTNSDATPVAGIIGVQKNLYTEQISSYVKDAENKGVKLMADIWTSAKALDDSVQMPGPVPGNLMMALNKYINNLDLPNAMASADSPGTGAPSSDADWNTPGDQ
jgi:quinol monooxygenase YgiN